MFPVLPYGFPTPDSLPEETVCRTLTIPNETVFLSCFMGALRVLAEAENWQQTGSITPEEAAAAAFEIIDQAYNANVCPSDTVDTPYWDDSVDVDDELPDDEQPWYGQVADAASAPTELDFIEDATIWAFSGLIVLSLGLAGVAPALAFRTTASKFVLSYKNGGTGNIIRFFVDGVKIYQGVDTGGGEITDVPVIGDPDEDTHQIYATSEIA